MAILQVQNLSKTYYRNARGASGLKQLITGKKEAVEALKDINFSIERGERIALLGANGAGKSTFVKLATGIIAPSDGSIALFDLDPFKKRKLCSANYGVVFGSRKQLKQNIPVMESFKLSSLMYGFHSRDVEERLAYFDRILDINELLHVKPRKMSFGQRIRSEITFSLFHLPKIVFLDEATIGLDVVVRKDIIDLLNSLVRDEKMTLLVTSHLVEDVDRLSDRLLLLDNGRLIYDGDKLEFQKQVKDERNIKVEFGQKLDEKLEKPFLNYENYSRNAQSLSFTCESAQIPEVMQKLSSYRVNDIKITEPSLETILRDIFKRKEVVL